MHIVGSKLSHNPPDGLFSTQLELFDVIWRILYPFHMKGGVKNNATRVFQAFSDGLRKEMEGQQDADYFVIVHQTQSNTVFLLGTTCIYWPVVLDLS